MKLTIRAKAAKVVTPKTSFVLLTSNPGLTFISGSLWSPNISHPVLNGTFLLGRPCMPSHHIYGQMISCD